MDHFIIGTAGHIDHGKTSLVRALTGKDTDTLKEEQERKITIDIGFAFLDDNTTVIDVPGHEKFIKNMVAGVSTIDFVILVIAADDGVMPQTREHLDIIKLLDIKDGMVVVTKSSMVEEDWLELVIEDIKDFVSDSFLADKPVVAVDSISGKNIDIVRETIERAKEKVISKSKNGVFRLPVDRVFISKGHGTVVTGTILSGSTKEGDLLKVQPLDKEVRVRSLESHGKKMDLLKTGDRAAINLHGISKDEINRGDIITTPGYLKPTYMFESNLFLLNSSKELKNRERVRVHAGTSEVLGRVYTLEDSKLFPGEKGLVQIRLEDKLSISIGDRFVIRTYSPQVTIGGGKVITTSVKKIKSSDSERIEMLKDMNKLDPAGFIEKIIFSKNDKGVFLKDLSLEITMELDDTTRFVNELILGKRVLSDGKKDNPFLIEVTVYKKFRESILSSLENFHLTNKHKIGISKSEIKSIACKRSGQNFFDLIIKKMLEEKLIEVEDNIVKRFGFTPKFDKEMETLINKVYNHYDNKGFNSNPPKEIFTQFCNTEKLFYEAISILIQEKKLVKINDNIFLSGSGYEKLIDLLKRKMKENGEIAIKDISDNFNTSRKFSIPILEYLDKNKITRREGDIRVLA
ncbi:MAG: selenocysteine-specific translation elongation factor [Candidatus Cloacimonadota bacterium]|nr:MAG: selenocysteine-specific translation elongation factor [Candidatus Cloacimonadota bacterium]PIE78013.1 MAG: selenocysteine-specific translation elongation factor [Candidatus Delongbacteria bacterium]